MKCEKCGSEISKTIGFVLSVYQKKTNKKKEKKELYIY